MDITGAFSSELFRAVSTSDELGIIHSFAVALIGVLRL